MCTHTQVNSFLWKEKRSNANDFLVFFQKGQFQFLTEPSEVSYRRVSLGMPIANELIEPGVGKGNATVDNRP